MASQRSSPSWSSDLLHRGSRSTGGCRGQRAPLPRDGCRRGPPRSQPRHAGQGPCSLGRPTREPSSTRRRTRRQTIGRLGAVEVLPSRVVALAHLRAQAVPTQNHPSEPRITMASAWQSVSIAASSAARMSGRRWRHCSTRGSGSGPSKSSLRDDRSRPPTAGESAEPPLRLPR